MTISQVKLDVISRRGDAVAMMCGTGYPNLCEEHKKQFIMVVNKTIEQFDGNSEDCDYCEHRRTEKILGRMQRWAECRG
jgi:hypothetical protein